MMNIGTSSLCLCVFMS